MKRSSLTLVAIFVASLAALILCAAADPGAGLGLLVLLPLVAATFYWLTRDSQPHRTAPWTREDEEMLAFMMFDDALDDWDE